jgi:hypothetical protein
MKPDPEPEPELIRKSPVTTNPNSVDLYKNAFRHNSAKRKRHLMKRVPKDRAKISGQVM